MKNSLKVKIVIGVRFSKILSLGAWKKKILEIVVLKVPEDQILLNKHFFHFIRVSR